MNHIREKMLLYSLYDVSKTLNENLNLINEQSSQYIQPKQSIDNTFVQKRNYKIDTTDLPQLSPTALKGTSEPQPPSPITSMGMPGSNVQKPYKYTRYEGKYSESYNGYTTYQFMSDKLDWWNKIYKEDLRKWKQSYDPIGDFMIEHRHGLLDIASIGLSLLGPPGLVASMIVDTANAGLFVAEGNSYEAGLRIAFLTIPFHQLIPVVPALRKIGQKGFNKLLLKLGKPGIITATEKAVLDEAEQNSKIILRLILKRTYTQFIMNSVKNFTIPNWIKFLVSLSKKYPRLTHFMKTSVLIGGVSYTYDQIARYFGITPGETENKEKMKEINTEFEKDPNKVSANMTNDLVDFIISSPDAVKMLDNIIK